MKKIVHGPLTLSFLTKGSIWSVHWDHLGTYDFAHTWKYSEDYLQSHAKKAHLGWGGRERDKKQKGAALTEATNL